MSTVPYPIDWSVPYLPDCSRNRLRKHLRELSGHWSGWDAFPWYLTRTLHRHMDGPPSDWDHLHTRFWITGLAATILLKGRFEDRNDVFDLLIRQEVQFVGILRHLIADQIRWCLMFRKLDRLPDCAKWGADTEYNEQGLKERRDSFRGGVDLAISEFIRVLNFASAVDNREKRIAGQPLWSWYKGAYLPDVREVPVRVSEEGGCLYLRPDADASARFLSRRQPVPRIELTPDAREELSSDVGDQRSQDGHDKASATAQGLRRDMQEASDTDEIARRTAIATVEMAMRLDDNPRLNQPTHCTVLGMYMRDNLTVRKIAAKCRCSHATVVNRKKRLEKVTGMPLDALKVNAQAFAAAEKVVNDGRARNIYRKGLKDS